MVQTHQGFYVSLRGANCLVTNYNYPGNVATDNSASFKCISSILKKTAAADNNGVLKGAKIAILLKYIFGIIGNASDKT